MGILQINSKNILSNIKSTFYTSFICNIQDESNDYFTSLIDKPYLYFYYIKMVKVILIITYYLCKKDLINYII
jgi:hypothetical protein